MYHIARYDLQSTGWPTIPKYELPAVDAAILGRWQRWEVNISADSYPIAMKPDVLRT